MSTGARSNVLAGYGKSHGSFGELLQGRTSDGRDFLITLPIDMWSICNLTAIERSGPLVINCELDKSKRVAHMLLEKLGIVKDYEINISFSRNIPIGKGLSSSTADMLSTVRALQEIFGFLLREKTISEIFVTIEPHDGLMYKSCVVYDHRKGELVGEMMYIPEYTIISLDLGGEVDTMHYNRKLSFTADVMAEYDDLLQKIRASFAAQDDRAIAHNATESARIHVRSRPDPVRQHVLDTFDRFGAMGVVNTHSGTCLGLIYPRATAPEQVLKLSKEISQYYGHGVFITNTLRLLV